MADAVKHYRLWEERRLDRVYFLRRSVIDSFDKADKVECLNCHNLYTLLFSHDDAEHVIEDPIRPKDRHHLVRGQCRICNAIIAEKEYTNPNFTNIKAED